MEQKKEFKSWFIEKQEKEFQSWFQRNKERIIKLNIQDEITNDLLKAILRDIFVCGVAIGLNEVKRLLKIKED